MKDWPKIVTLRDRDAKGWRNHAKWLHLFLKSRNKWKVFSIDEQFIAVIAWFLETAAAEVLRMSGDIWTLTSFVKMPLGTSMEWIITMKPSIVKVAR